METGPRKVELQDVNQCDGFKYLPATVINDIGLRELVLCNAEAILVRDEYRFTFDALWRGARITLGG